MKYLIALICVSLMSCTFLCNLGKSGADRIAKSMQNRWQCDYQVTYDYFSKPVKEYICKDENKFIVPSFLTIGLCKVAVDALSSMAAIEIASKFKCNEELVLKDLGASSNICSLLGLL